MNREDIERMARAAKGHAYTNKYALGETAFAFSIDRLERFVEMVAAAEREACAELCLQWNASHPEALAAAIRARGNT